LLKAALARHFEKIAKEEFISKKGKSDEKFDDNELKSKPWEVVEVNFAQSNLGEVEYYLKLTEIRNQFLRNKFIISKGGKKSWWKFWQKELPGQQ
jgi:hypothetical protein